jgi:RalA-binding protein 1
MHFLIAEEPPIFAVPLETAVQRSRCHDGVLLPLVVRNCMDFVEDCGEYFSCYIVCYYPKHMSPAGLTVEGIYKSTGNKNKVQQLRKMYNNREHINFIDCDPVTVAGLFKTFLRYSFYIQCTTVHILH